MKNKWLFIAGLSGFLCVTIGAFAAHGLSKVLEPKELAWIETGVKYQMFHTCIQPLNMRNIKTNRDWAEFFGNKRDEYR